MKLIPVDVKEFEALINKNTSNYKVLSEFIDSGMDCARLDGFSQKRADICANSLRAAIKRYKFGVRVIVNRGEVFLVKVK